MIALLRRYWDERVSYEGGLAIVWMDALLLVPFLMAAFFYPLQALLAAVVFLGVTFGAYEGYVLYKIWRKRHPAHT